MDALHSITSCSTSVPSAVAIVKPLVWGGRIQVGSSGEGGQGASIPSRGVAIGYGLLILISKIWLLNMGTPHIDGRDLRAAECALVLLILEMVLMSLTAG
jgi:hypothetical protein